MTNAIIAIFRRHSTLHASALIALSLVFVQASKADEAASPRELIESLRAGGHIIYVRHASTEKDYADQISADPTNCATQRTLSEAGWREASLIGTAFRNLSIPIGLVLSSQYCRAWQTAELAFGRSMKLPALNFEPAEDYTSAQVATMRANVAPLLAQAPQAGSNTVIVGHDDPFEAATGIYPEPMGVAFVVRPREDGNFTVLGSITPDQWPAVMDELR